MPDSEQPFIRIGNREIYDTLRSNTEAIRQLENRVDLVLSENVAIKTEYGSRIRSLELRFYGVLAGLIAAVTSLGVGFTLGA